MTGRFPMARALIIAGALLALGSTRAAGEEPVLALEVIVASLGLITALWPDHHFGLLVVLLVGVHWLIAVDDATTPWVIAAAVSVALVHTAAAAASIAPPATPWSQAMTRRWIRRFGLITAASAPTLLMVLALEQTDPPTSPALLTAALLVLAIAGLWARHNSLTTTAESEPL